MSGNEAARASAWTRANAVVIAAVLLIAASLWWKAVLLSHSFFRLDDYIYLARASHSGLTWSYLMWVDAGHLTPLGYAIAWLVVRLSPVDWALTSAVTLALLAVTCLALLRMLRTLFGDHPGILILLTVYLLSPLSLSGLSWWTVTLELLPLQAAIFFAVTAHVNYLRTGRPKHAIAAAAWLFVGMAASLRGAAVPLLLLALTSAFFVDGPWLRAVWAILRYRWRVWLLYFTITAGYLVLYGAQLATSSIAPGRPGSFTGVFSFAATQLRDNFIPGSLGGPWHWLGAGVYAAADPPAGLARASWVVAAAIVVISIFYSPRAWRVAFLPIAGQVQRRFHGLRYYRPLRTAAACVFTAIVIGSVWSYDSYPTDRGAAVGRSYVATARIALAQAPSGTVIVDDPVPQDVMGGAFSGSLAEASGLLTPLISGEQKVKPRFIKQPDGTYNHLKEFDGWGRLVPAVVSGAGSLPLATGKACLPSRQGTAVVKLSSAVQHAQILRLAYLAGSRGRLILEFGGQTLVYRYERGLNAAFLPVHGSGHIVTIEATTGKLPCFGDVEAGVLLPSGAGPAIPALAVNG